MKLKIKIMQIPNVEKLIEIIEQSCGNILLHLPDNTVRDLKMIVLHCNFLNKKHLKVTE